VGAEGRTPCLICCTSQSARWDSSCSGRSPRRAIACRSAHVRLRRVGARGDVSARVPRVGPVQTRALLRTAMTTLGILQILAFFGIVFLLTKPVGLFMSRLFQG